MLDIKIVSILNPTCFGDHAVVAFNVSGGTTPQAIGNFEVQMYYSIGDVYYYTVSTSASQMEINVTDSNNCALQQLVNIVQPQGNTYRIPTNI